MTGIDRSLPNPSTLPLLLISHTLPPSLSFISPSSSRLHPNHSPCVNPLSSSFRSDGRYGCKPSFSLRWHSLFSVPPKVSITRSLSHATRDTVPIVHSHVALLTRTRNTLCSLCHRRSLDLGTLPVLRSHACSHPRSGSSQWFRVRAPTAPDYSTRSALASPRAHRASQHRSLPQHRRCSREQCHRRHSAPHLTAFATPSRTASRATDRTPQHRPLLPRSPSRSLSLSLSSLAAPQPRLSPSLHHV
jgi:hypothetical protein